MLYAICIIVNGLKEKFDRQTIDGWQMLHHAITWPFIWDINQDL